MTEGQVGGEWGMVGSPESHGGLSLGYPSVPGQCVPSSFPDISGYLKFTMMPRCPYLI